MGVHSAVWTQSGLPCFFLTIYVRCVMISLFNNVLFRVTKYCAWVGMVALLGAVTVTTSDVILRKINDGGVYGAIDLVQLAIMSAAYLSIPYTFMSRAHVAVTMFTDKMSRRWQAATQVLAMAISCVVMSSIVYFSYHQALLQAEFGDVSMIVGIPMVYYWIPLILGSTLSAIVTLHITIENLFTVLTDHSGHNIMET
jgi:TRAP-type C4-dicarboxylate transport system permease small subunit